MCDLEGPLNMIQGVLYWFWSSCVPGKPGKFGEFQSGQGKVKENGKKSGKSQGK